MLIILLLTLALVPILIYASDPEDPSVLVHPRDGVVMIYIPAGPFTMGTNTGWKDASPEHQVELPGFYIDKYEVTISQFRRFVADGGLTDPRLYQTEQGRIIFQNEGFQPRFWPEQLNQEDNLPMYGVRYFEALAYCKWAGKTLPTAQQWEKAARGTDGRLYPWGNEWDSSRVNALEDAVASGVAGDYPKLPAPVDAFPAGASPYGVMQMAGNVLEWTLETMAAYPGNTNPYAFYPHFHRAFVPELRGGSWQLDRRFTNTTFRTAQYESISHRTFGFRCACEEIQEIEEVGDE